MSKIVGVDIDGDVDWHIANDGVLGSDHQTVCGIDANDPSVGHNGVVEPKRSQRDHYWRPALKRLKIRWRRPYNTRHTYATVALMGRVPVAYIAAQLGHSVKMLLDKYARWIPANDDGAARAMLAASMGSNNAPGGQKVKEM